MTQDEIIEMARQAGFMMENSAAIQAAEIFAKLVAAKALAQPEQLHASEDVSIGVDVTEDGAHVTALRSYRNGAKVVFYSQFHTAPPQRTWVGLTDEQIDACWNKDLWKEKQPHHIFAKAIEAKLKDKNCVG